MSNFIKIGFDEDEEVDRYSLNEENETRPGNRVAYEPKKSIYLSPARIAALEADYDCVVVHEYGDEYHLSEEERKAKNRYYETFKVLNKAKRTYRKIDEYVTVYREALKCLNAVAENNGLYSPAEFKKMYFKGKIVINGLNFPKYKGRDKKELSWDYIAEFVLSDNDPKELIRQKNDDIFTPEEMEEQSKVMFSKKEWKELFRPETKEEIQADKLYFDVDEDSPYDKNIVISMDNEETKKLIKKEPTLLSKIKEIKRGSNSSEHLKRYAYELALEDIDVIEQYDRKHGYTTSSMMPEFKGDIMNDKDYKKYMLQLNEYEEENFKESYHGKLRTLGEIRELEVKSLLEENGWNIRNLYNNKEREKKLNKAIKEDKKREKLLKQQLLKVQNRNKRRMGEDVETGNKSKKKKKKSKKSEGD